MPPIQREESSDVMAEATTTPKQCPLLRNLQYSPLKQDDEQYIMLWDPMRISMEKLIIPLSYFFLIQHFDGEHSLEEVATLYLKKFGEFLNPDRLYKLVDDLEEKLFLEGARFETAKAAAVGHATAHATYKGEEQSEDQWLVA